MRDLLPENELEGPEHVCSLLRGSVNSYEQEIFEGTVDRAVDIGGDPVKHGFRYARDVFLIGLAEEKELGAWRVYDWSFESPVVEADGSEASMMYEDCSVQASTYEELFSEIKRFDAERIPTDVKHEDEYHWFGDQIPVELKADYREAEIWNKEVNKGEKGFFNEL